MTVRWFDTLDSTNSEALRHLDEYPSGTVIAAREQTAGRGQRGNRWFAEAGQNLTFSIVLKFHGGEIPVVKAPWLNFLAAGAVAAYLEDQGVACSVKWPNDIYAGRRKICGMLLENSLSGASLAASVIGIGINVNQREFPQLANATSLALQTGRTYAVGACLTDFLAVFEQQLPALFAPSQLEEYNARLFRKGEAAAYRDLLTDREFRGIILGVTEDGRLHIQDAGTREERFYRFKEISYIL